MDKAKLNIYLKYIGVGVLFYLSYVFSFKRTLELRDEVNLLIQNVELTNKTPDDLNLIKSKIENLNSALGYSNHSPNQIQQDILKLSSEICDTLNNIRVEELSKPITLSSEKANIIISKILLQGTFNSLLVFLNKFESKIESGRVVSVKLESKKENGSGVAKLYLSVFIQNIKLK